MHEHYSGIDHSAPTRTVDFALHHYGRAMREVAANRSSLPKHVDKTLVTCALFSTFETLRGQYHEACSHAISGINILAEEQARLGRASPDSTPASREALCRFFIAMGRQIQELGDESLQVNQSAIHFASASISKPKHFTSHEHALIRLEFLLDKVIAYGRTTDELAKQGAISEKVAQTLVKQFKAIKREFEAWSAAFRAFSASDLNEFSQETPESSPGSSPDSTTLASQHRPPRSPAFLILKVYYSLIAAYLARIERNDENVLDNFIPDLRAALDAAEEFVRSTSTYVKPMEMSSLSPTSREMERLGALIARPSFSLALGIMPVVFLIASRISDIEVQKRAHAILRTCNRREGLWDSKLVSKIVDRILELRAVAASIQSQLDDRFDGVSDTALLHTTFVPRPATSEATNLPFQPPADASYSVPSHGGFTDPRDFQSSNVGVEFKLLDINFFPDRKCTMSYTFLASTGERLDTATIPTYSNHEHLLPARRVFQGDYTEEIRWET
jgi:hypothetical protein